uniref:Adenosinetriphosphatase n=1 Tax=Opuntia streptacantha TaxID=393608 RepID=A0A7C9AKM1_OPUST
MDPEAIRRCMSFGFSDKKSKSAIGRYGNGFKTSTMRLGADVIVFSRHLGNRRLTQSIGLLSYTYLSLTGLDRIVVPMVDYEYNVSTSTFEPLHPYGQEHFQSNISIFLQWSPYSSELELMKQFDDMGSHGTKVIVYNLWFTDDGNLEFDLQSDPEDIRLEGSSIVEKVGSRMSVSEEHIGNQYRYSLRVYLSILYLQIPQNFCIMLRGKVVQHHNIAQDLKFPEFILYKPQTGGTKEGEVMTTIGFLKEAPHVSIHGFNIYHKNRLVLPFWPVVSYTSNRGRGVVGVLEANFVEPIHNKQDFERTSLFQKLEYRLKEMTWEYWDYHCGLIGYHVTRKTRVPTSSSETPCGGPNITRDQPLVMSRSSNLVPDPVFDISPGSPAENTQSSSRHHGIKGMQDDFLLALGRVRRRAREGSNAASAGHSVEIQHATYTVKPANREAVVMENKKLRAKCLQHKKTEQELRYKLSNLRSKLEEAQKGYVRMFRELQSLELGKPDNAGV